MSSEWGCMLELLINKYFSNNSEKFNQLSHEMKVFYCYKNLKIRRELSKWIKSNILLSSRPTKSSILSKEFREKGNEKFKASNDEASLELYSKSIIYAPSGSAELSLALGNRSAVLFRLEKYEECIRDVDFAINNFDNKALYPKLMTRKIKSFARLKKYEEGFQSLNVLREFICQERNIPKSILEECMKEFNEFNPTETSETEKFQYPQVLDGKNETFPFASNALALELYSGSRRVIARKTLQPGDILFVENPFSFVLLRQSGRDHCQLCCKLLFAAVACSKCVQCLYCSYQCMMEAQNSFHKWECNGFDMLENLGVGHLALRTFLIASQNFDSPRRSQMNELVSHLDDIPVMDILFYTLTSTMLMVYLEEYTDFLSLSSGPKAVEGIGFFILKNMIQIICNAFAIKKSLNNLEELSQVTYASGMFPSAAMMDHSCEPNIVTSFYDNLLVVRASRRIEQGEEIFNCYGPHFRKMNTATRKEILRSQFFFDCECCHCRGDVNENPLYLCLKCQNPFGMDKYQKEVNCSSCSGTTDIQVYIKLLEKMTVLRKKGIDCMNSKDFEKARCIFTECSQLQRSFLHESNLELFDNTMDLAECYYVLGDYENSWKNFNSNVLIAEKHFGEFDMEYSALILRIIDAFLPYMRNRNDKIDKEILEELLNLADKMMKAVEMNLGSWSKGYSLLLAKKNSLMNLKTSDPRWDESFMKCESSVT